MYILIVCVLVHCTPNSIYTDHMVHYAVGFGVENIVGLEKEQKYLCVEAAVVGILIRV